MRIITSPTAPYLSKYNNLVRFTYNKKKNNKKKYEITVIIHCHTATLLRNP